MGKRKPVSIFRRPNISQGGAKDPHGGSGKKRRQGAPPGHPPDQPVRKKQKPSSSQPASQPRPANHWHAASVIDRQAATAVAKMLHADATGTEGASIKSLTLGPAIQAKKATYAVTCETLRMLPVIRQLVSAAGLLEQDARLSQATAFVLCYEVLFGEGLRQKGPAERLVLDAAPVLQQRLAEMKAEAGVADARDLIRESAQSAAAQRRPRSARVNTLKLSVAEALTWIRSAKGKQSSQLGMQMTVDELLPDVLLFPPATDLHDHPLVKSSCLILQSKASCMPAHALAPQAGWDVLDACAAPGNKTTHLAALMQGKGRVMAFDKDPKRLQRLRANAAATGADCITARVADFLQLPLATSAEFRNVRGALVDPSCSGSGTALSRMDFLLPSHAAQHSLKRSTGSAAEALPAADRSSAKEPVESRKGDAPGNAEQGPPSGTIGRGKQNGGKAADSRSRSDSAEAAECELHGVEGGEEHDRMHAGLRDKNGGRLSESDRVERLARFQEAAVRHALTLPALQRLVYSTCSVHERENEAVVAAVLPQARELGFELVDPFPRWHRRGLAGSVEGAERLVRTDAVEDGTDGFFLAVFQRRPEHTEVDD